MKKIFLAVLFISVLLGLYFFTPLRDYLSPEGFGTLKAWIETQGAWAPLIFGLLYAIATVFALPGSALTIGGGLLFGVAWGTAINLAGATLGACLAFLISRTLGRETAAKFLKKLPRLDRVNEKMAGNGFYAVLFLRLVPLFPFNGLNYALGLTGVRFRDYCSATAIGMLPGAFVFTSLGAAGRHIRLSDPATWSDIRVWGPFVLVLLLSLLPKFFGKRKPPLGD